MVDHILEFPRPEVGNCLNWDSTKYCSHNAARNKDNKEVVTYFPSIGTPFRIYNLQRKYFFSLEKVEKMAAFDIHLYGSKILEQFPSENR